MKIKFPIIAFSVASFFAASTVSAVPHMKDTAEELEKVIHEILDNLPYVPDRMKHGFEELAGKVELCIPVVEHAMKMSIKHGHDHVKEVHKLHAHSRHKFLHKATDQMQLVLETTHEKAKTEKDKKKLREMLKLTGELYFCIPVIKGIAVVRDFGTRLRTEKPMPEGAKIESQRY